MYRKMDGEIANLTEQVSEQAEQRCGARQLRIHPGVGPVTALATDEFLGDPHSIDRLKCDFLGSRIDEYVSEIIGLNINKRCSCFSRMQKCLS